MEVVGRPSHSTEDPAPGRHRAAAVADPGPLGLAAFAMTTFFLSAVNAHVVPASVEVGVLGLALFYGGIAQLFAGMWEFIKGNTFGAVAFCSYGAFWLSFWYLLSQGGTEAMGSDKGTGVGLFLLGWTIFTTYMFVCSIRTNRILAAVFSALTLTFLFLTLGSFSASATLTQLGGWLGLVTAVLAWYGSMAGVMNATADRPVLPIFTR
ncbi:MAG TPA: acetate uptake transporter [Mycobacterium sp.]|nr:acetate uptake transporter [Mycobacterium sp.]